MNYHKKKQDLSKKIASERIEILFGLADENFHEHPERSERYVTLAKLISMRYKVPVPVEHKRRICKSCGAYLVPGSNCRIRLKNECVLVTCLACQNQMHYPYTEKRAPKGARKNSGNVRKTDKNEKQPASEN